MLIPPTSRALSPPQTPDTAALQKAADGFEEIFLGLLMKSARAASLGDDVFGSSAVNQTQAMFDAEIARQSSARSGLGIADAVVRQFTPPERRTSDVKPD
jgi:peptidoglycan hydrolase FlgJ